MTSINVRTFTDQNFESEVLRSNIPVLVEFMAPWSAPCRSLAATIDRIADDYVGRLKVGMLNTDTSQAVARRYSVRSIPTIFVFRGGQKTGQYVGVTDRARLLQSLGLTR